MIQANDEQFDRIVRKVESVTSLDGATVGVLGIAFKAGTDDTEVSAIEVMKRLLAKGAMVKAYDPAVASLNLDGVDVVGSAYAACEGASAIVVATEWDEFTSLDFDRVGTLVAERNMIDARISSTGTRAHETRFHLPGWGAPDGPRGDHRWSRLPGSHLADELLGRRRRGCRHRQPLDREQRQHRALSLCPASRSWNMTSRSMSGSRAASMPCSTSPALRRRRLSQDADSDPQGRLARHPQHVGSRKGQGCDVLPCVDLGGLRDRRCTPDRGLLGQCQSGRPSWGLRRGQALLRGDDDGVPPLPRTRHPHRPDLQHLRASHAARGRSRRVDLHRAGAQGRAAHHLR